MTAYTLLNTLYVMTAGAYLHLDNDTVRVDVGHETRLRVPLHHLGGVITFGDVMLSPALVGRCATAGISMTLLDRNGRFQARIEGPINGNILLRQAQFEAVRDAPRCLSLARQVVLGKLRNTRTVIQRGAREARVDEDRESLDAAILRLDASLRAAAVASDLDILRGVEGEAARAYFSTFGRLIRSDLRQPFTFDGRNRRPPRDRVNALLSFFYTLVTHDCRAAVESVGLDSQLGFLHAMRPGRPALALDLAEEFRSVLADRAVLTLINRRQIKEDDFRFTEGGAVLLADDARRAASVAWQERKQETLTHPLLDAEVPVGLLPQIQARLLARTLRGDTEGYLPFVAR